MITRTNSAAIAKFACSALLLASAFAVEAETRIDSAFNLSSVDRDQEIGQRLAAAAPGTNFDYRFKVVSVPVGTVLMVSFDEALSSATSQSGDRFTARVVEPVRVNGRIAIPARNRGENVVLPKGISVEIHLDAPIN